jgi:pimeloyl-ACP methyl ester carboxylesterase
MGSTAPAGQTSTVDLPVPDRTGFVELNRTRLRVWEWGDPDHPPVICAHGAFDHGRMWDGIAPGLAALGWRVVAPDQRGHGDSGRLSSGHVWSANMLDLAALARHLGPPVGLIGHSFGGGQSLALAAVWPELVRWVVNLDGLGPPAAGFEERDIAEMARSGFAGLARAKRPPRVYPTLADMAARRGRVNVRLSDAWLLHLVRHGAREVEGGFVWKADPLFPVGLPGSFSLDHLNAQHDMVTRPLLVLTGAEHDTWSELTGDELDDRLAHLPHARHEIVDGAGHYVHIEQPGAVLASIAAFLAEVDGVPGPAPADAGADAVR